MRTTCFAPTPLTWFTKAFRCPTNSSIGTCWRPLQCKDHVMSCHAKGTKPACQAGIPAGGQLATGASRRSCAESAALR